MARRRPTIGYNKMRSAPCRAMEKHAGKAAAFGAIGMEPDEGVVRGHLSAAGARARRYA